MWSSQENKKLLCTEQPLWLYFHEEVVFQWCPQTILYSCQCSNLNHPSFPLFLSTSLLATRNGNTSVMCLGGFHSQCPVQAEPASSKKRINCRERASSQHGHLPAPYMLAVWHRSVGILIMSFIFSSRASQKALGFFSPYQKEKRLWLWAVLLRKTNKKGFGGATLSKIVLLWGFHLLDFF